MTLRELMDVEDPLEAVGSLIGYKPKRVSVSKESGSTWVAMYIYINPRRMVIRKTASIKDINDGTVTEALLDLDHDGQAIGLELIRTW